MGKFSYMTKTAIFTLSIAAFGLIPVAQSVAEQRHNNNRYDQHRNYNNHNGRGNQRYYNRHYNKHNYNRHNYSRYYGNYNNHNHHGGGEVALGLLTGGLLFYALTANQRSRDTVYVQQQPVYVQQQPVYVQPQGQQWTQQQPVQQQMAQNSSCLQIREYQTTITVGGNMVPAYGQSCLQPDGTWKLGPAIPEPN
ncbi:MAG: hypothetical protein K9G26_10865 [Emcibacter sp.]|nr:hypothetical protein [Emcibacter sp.]